MTVTKLITRNDYTVTGATQAAFDYKFLVLEKSDIVVYVNGVVAPTANYSVSPLGDPVGGTVTFTVDIPVSANTVSLVLEMPLDRTTNYQNSGDFLASTVNADFDKIYVGAIQNENFIDRGIRLQNVEPTPNNGAPLTMDLPLKAARLGRLLGFDTVHGVPIMGPLITDVTGGLTLKSTLANGNITGGTNIDITSGDGISMLANSITINKFLDENDMASNSATALATQQSIKAYVDSAVGLFDSLEEVLANGNTTNGSNIVVSSGDSISIGGQLSSDIVTTIDATVTDNDLATASAIKSYVDSSVPPAESLANTLLAGNTTSGSNIEMTTGDSIKMGASISLFSTDGTLGSNSDAFIPTQKAIKTYVDNAVPAAESLANTLLAGNVTGGTEISVSSGDAITFAGNGKLKHGTDSRIEIDSGGVDLFGAVFLKSQIGQPASSLKFSQGATINEFSIDGTLSGDSNTTVPTEKAVKTYVDANAGAGTLANTLLAGNTSGASNIVMADSQNIQFGSNASKNIKISHDGTNGLIKEIGSGGLQIQGEYLQIRGDDGVSGMTISPTAGQTWDDISFQTGLGGSVKLYIDDNGIALQSGVFVKSIETNTSLSTSNTTLSTTGAIKAYVDANAGGGGTVTSVGITHAGDAFAVGSAVTTSGTLDITMSGSSTEYINGEGNLITFPAASSGTVSSIGASIDGDAIAITGSPVTTSGTLGFSFDGASTDYINGEGNLTAFPAVSTESLKNTLIAGNITDGTDLIVSTGDVLDVADFFKLNAYTVQDIVNTIDATTNAFDLVTGAAVKAYVTSQIPATESLSATLAIGNTTGGNDIILSVLDDLKVVNSSAVEKIVIDRKSGEPALGNVVLRYDTDGAVFEADGQFYSSDGTKRLYFQSAGGSLGDTIFANDANGSFKFENTSGSQLIAFDNVGAISIMNNNVQAVPANSALSVDNKIIIDDARNIKNVPIIYNAKTGSQAIDLNNNDALILNTQDGHSALLLSGGALDTNYYSNDTHRFRAIDPLDIFGDWNTTKLQVLTNFQLGTSIQVSSILDEDNMTSNSPTALATQQSIKAYVDANAGGGGSVTSVSSTIGGDAITVTGSPITGSGTLAYAFQGNSTHYINGAGNYITFPSTLNDSLEAVLSVSNLTNGFNIVVTSGDKLTTNTIDETTLGTGVTVEGVINKDGNIGIGTSKTISFGAGDLAEFTHNNTNFVIDNTKGDIFVNNTHASADFRYTDSNGLALRIFPNPVDASASVFDFNGTIETQKLKLNAGTYVNEIITSTSLAGATNDELATALAIKTYVDNSPVGDITDVTVSAPITGGGSSGSVGIGITKATTSADGYISSADWNTFNNKTTNVGTVTSVTVNGNAYTASGTGAVTIAPQGTASQYINGAGNLVTFPTDQQGVTSVGLAVGGNALTVSGSPVTSTGTLSVTPQGTSSQYINGAGNLITFPSIPQGSVTSVGQTHQGNAFGVTGSPVTSSGTLGITVVGSASQYINGAGNLVTFPSDQQGVTSVSSTFGGNSISVSGSPITSSGTLAYGFAGTSSQYINGAGNLTTFPSSFNDSLDQVLSNGNTTNGNDIVVSSGDKLAFSNGLTIDSQASNTVISETASGSLLIRGTNLALQSDDNDNYIQCVENGAVTLYHQISGNSQASLNTTTLGVNVNGRMESDSLYLGSGAIVTTISTSDSLGTSDTTLSTTGAIKSYVDTAVAGVPVGDITGVSATSPLTGGGTSGNVTLAIQVASGSQSGYLSSTNWTTFNNKSNFSGAYNDLTGKPTIPTDNNQIGNGEGYTTNTGTVTGVTFNGNAFSASGSTTVTIAPQGSPSQYVNGQGNLATFPSARGVTSVGVSIGGNAYAESNSPITSTGTISLNPQGSSNQYVTGQGNLATFPSIPSVGNGTLTVTTSGSASGGGTFTANQSGNSSFNIAVPSIPSVGNGTFTVATSGSATGGGSMTANQSGNSSVTINVPSIPSVYNPAITFNAQDNMTGGGTITLNQSNSTAVNFKSFVEDNITNPSWTGSLNQSGAGNGIPQETRIDAGDGETVVLGINSAGRLVGAEYETSLTMSKAQFTALGVNNKITMIPKRLGYIAVIIESMYIMKCTGRLQAASPNLIKIIQEDVNANYATVTQCTAGQMYDASDNGTTLIIRDVPLTQRNYTTNRDTTFEFTGQDWQATEFVSMTVLLKYRLIKASNYN